MKDILHKLQKFTKIPLTKMKIIDAEIMLFYDEEENVAGEVHEQDGCITCINIYNEPFFEDEDETYSNSEIIETSDCQNYETKEVPAEQIRALAYEIIETFDDRPLTLDALVDFDANYLAIFEATDDRYGMALPNSGAHVTIQKDGTFSSASFFHDDYTVNYPETWILTEEAVEKLRQEQLIVLGLETSNRPWSYNYVPNYNVFGVDVHGRIKYLSDFPELQNIGYDELPNVVVSERLHTLIVGDDEQAMVEVFEDDHLQSWSIVQDDVIDEIIDNYNFLYVPEPVIYNYTKEQLYERAFKALRYVVGEEYGNYKLERTPNTTALLEKSLFSPSTWGEESYIIIRFVYHFKDIQLHEHAVEMIIDFTYARILSLTVPKIPYAELNKLTPPMITIDEANALARDRVNVQLTFERTDLDENVYELAYMIDYPDSPTGGNIESIDAVTGEITYVDTGFVKF
ncbi:hypothetical protein [Solibacillus sp. FSL H8-0538]|uniref:hypothetical protein n=1 Tax=Solibacillus sp. FSL H8-0538 TaxID=2921400 RepID=UPI0030FAB29D